MPALSARPYEEPAIVEVLVLTSFLFLSNVVDFVLNRLLYCGLVGQILIGVAWGTPGGDLLPESIQDAVTQFGYLGLIMIVYEGGLATDLRALRGDLALSILVALIGTTIPIALSFSLQGFLDISALQAFAAGASLCSTSLGTTFTVLSASGLAESRLGVVLTSAAMMDDVVGLIMSGVISSLGSSASSFGAVTVIRPVFVSLAYATVLPLVCAFIVKPLTGHAIRSATVRKNERLAKMFKQEGASLLLQTLVLLGLITSASYAGTSELFAAYLAGVVITWWSDLVEACAAPMASAVPEQTKPEVHASSVSTSVVQLSNVQKPEPRQGADTNPSPVPKQELTSSSHDQQHRSGHAIYGKYFKPATDYILKPFFFASIGFAIPISQLFSGNVLWRGMVYSLLMLFAKLVCGLALIRFNLPTIPRRWMKKSASLLYIRGCWPFTGRTQPQQTVSRGQERLAVDAGAQSSEASAQGQPQPSPSPPQNPASTQPPHVRSPTPRSLYPAALLGCAMVARGEIGFLISNIAETDGIFDQGGDTAGGSEIFLVTTWAILICTIVGPVIVGTLVRRVRRLQTEERRQRTGRGDPLGPWGIRPT